MDVGTGKSPLAVDPPNVEVEGIIVFFCCNVCDVSLFIFITPHNVALHLQTKLRSEPFNERVSNFEASIKL